MTDPKDPFAAMLQMGQDWAKAMAPGMENLTPKGFEAMWLTMLSSACVLARQAESAGQMSTSTTV